MAGDPHLAFVPVLIGSFPRWLEYFEEHCPFAKPDQLALHRRTIALRQGHVTVSAAVSDSAFVQLLYDTLRAWGIGSRRSKLRSLPDFTGALRTSLPSIQALEGLRVDGEEMGADNAVDAVWNTIEQLHVVDNNAILVAGTKTLHHLLPELVPPMDREYTQRLFCWGNPQFQYAQRECFRLAFAALVFVARKVDPSQYVGTHPWHTSPTKVLDNALVGLVRAVDDGVQPPTLM